jgi:DNA-binding NarL/FixJ family response regulator
MRVLIAENHRDLSDVMVQLIDCEPDMRCVGQVEDACEVIDRARESHADAVVLDLMLRGGNGMGLIEELAALMPRLKIIVFSGLSNDELARESVKRGAHAFVVKGCDFSVLLDHLRADPPAPSQALRASL